ncbi:MAG: hypothetical protein GY851_17385 [bacterium]|nr:hypothetical protein [bacterium]
MTGRHRSRVYIAIAVLTVAWWPGIGQAQEDTEGMDAINKQRSAFFTDEVIGRAKANAEKYPWAAEAREAAVANAAPWLETSDDALWDLMFGPNITRSWMVWSDGYCPACKREVKMYNWIMDPRAHPWKTKCPECSALFPTNDFEAFHRSGYDDHGVFQPDLADRSLLFNADHPDPDDPLHTFGVDDGEGYVDEEGHRWRFVGCYLIYGQWKKAICDGVIKLSAAYAATGDSRYAYKAALMLDRIADVFPGFDFHEQGVVYEHQGERGQVSTWHDACAEVHQLVLAYDRIFEGARDEEAALVAFLAPKAQQHKLENPKQSWDDIQRNIEVRIFRDTLVNHKRILSNYPTTDVALLLIKTVLDWPGNREDVMTLLNGILEKSTAVDGVSGEKGLTGYACIAPRTVGSLLAQFNLLEPGFLKAVYERHPSLHDTYRFHADMWCMGDWYPRSGDCGSFGRKEPTYRGASLGKTVLVAPSMWTLLWDMYQITGDPVLAQVIHWVNGKKVEGLPYDLFAEDPEAIQQGVQSVINEIGPVIKIGSVNKEQWCLGLLRTGEGEHRRALWLDYDAWGAHGHSDGMNIGLFAKGLDLIPDFGYPPVGYGGWKSPQARWYKCASAHNTVVVDGKDQITGTGTTSLWADGDRLHAVRAAAPQVYDIERYERAVAMMDLDAEDSYVLDCFFVTGGADHAKFFHSSFGDVEVSGVDLVSAEDYGHGSQMRNFRSDPKPAPGWTVDWTIRDHYDYLPEGREVHVRHTDLTTGAEACLAEGWIDIGPAYSSDPQWIPRIMTRRRAESGRLVSTFVSVVDPYEGSEPNVVSARRLPLETMNARALPDTFVGVEVKRRDDMTDVWFVLEGRAPVEMVQADYDIHVYGDFAAVTFSPKQVVRIMLGRCQWIRIGNLSVVLKPDVEYIELTVETDGVHVVSGDREAVDYAEVDRQRVPVL